MNCTLPRHSLHTDRRYRHVSSSFYDHLVLTVPILIVANLILFARYRRLTSTLINICPLVFLGRHWFLLGRSGIGRRMSPYLVLRVSQKK